MDNATIARKLMEYADYLEGEDTNVHRVRAYRRAAEAVLAEAQSLSEIVAEKGRAGLEELPGIGARLGYTIEGLIRTGAFHTLKPDAGPIGPEQSLTSLPGIGRQLAHKLHELLGISTVDELERAAHEGRLDRAGVGPKRLRGLMDALDERLQRTRSSESLPGEPSVAALLAIDEAYRRRAEDASRPPLSSIRFDPEPESWLPIYVEDREGWHCRAQFSNTALAHRLGKTRDWVAVSFHDAFHSSQRTIVTETRGDLRGRRVVRGRERECRAYYEKHAPTPMGSDGKARCEP